MKILNNIPIYSHQKNYPTDWNFLAQSLGTFWNNIFKEKGVIKGLSQHHAEELINDYYTLTSVVNSFSIKNCPLLHIEKWYPLKIKKSEFKSEKFVFEENDAVFGSQPVTNTIYGNITFSFGLPKSTEEKVYLFDIKDNFKKCSVISNRIVFPSEILVYGNHFQIKDTTMFFNVNIFENSNYNKVDIIDDDGNKVDEEITLWIYFGEFDERIVQDYHGYIFDYFENTSKAYKNVILKLYETFSSGSTISNITSLICAFFNVPCIIENVETIEYIGQDVDGKLVVTDKHVYRITSGEFKNNIAVGQQLEAGFALSDKFYFYDNITSRNWWNILKHKHGIQKIAFSNYVFLGTYKGQIVLNNDYVKVDVDTNGKIYFPVNGDSDDITEFLNTINNSNISQFIDVANGSSGYVNIVDVLMSHYMGANTAVCYFKAYSDDDIQNLFKLMQKFKYLIPAHVYLIVFVELVVANEVFSKFNNSFEYKPGVLTHADFSVTDGIGTSEIAASLENNFKEINNYGFTISLSPNNLTSETLDGISDGAAAPNDPPLNATTQTYATLLLTTF